MKLACRAMKKLEDASLEKRGLQEQRLPRRRARGIRAPRFGRRSPSLSFLYLINTDIFISNLLAPKYVILCIVIHWLETWYSNNNLYTHYLKQEADPL